MSAGKKFQWLEILSKLHYRVKHNRTLYKLSFYDFHDFLCLMVSSRSKPAFLPPRNGQQPLSLGYITKICSSLTTIKQCLSKSFTYHRKKVAQTPVHSSLLISQSSFLSFFDDQNNEKPHRDGRKHFPWSPVYVTFLSMSCISNVFVEFLLRWHSQIWVERMIEGGLSLRTRSSSTGYTG